MVWLPVLPVSVSDFTGNSELHRRRLHFCEARTGRSDQERGGCGAAERIKVPKKAKRDLHFLGCSETLKPSVCNLYYIFLYIIYN